MSILNILIHLFFFVFEKGIVSRKFEGEIKRDLQFSQVLKILEEDKVHFKVEGKVLTVIP